MAELDQPGLQAHIGRRSALVVVAATIKKEVTTFRTAWHWAVGAGLLTRDYPNKGLVYPKEDELPPYQTFEKIERQVEAGGLTQAGIDDLWGCLYLRPSEIADLLTHVRDVARHPWFIHSPASRRTPGPDVPSCCG